MPDNSNITVAGAVKIKNLTDLRCYKSFEDMLLDLVNNMILEIPTSITNVVISNQQPTDDKRESLWIRLNSAGGFIGVYLFSDGSWTLIYPIPSSVYWFYGDSRNPPEGFRLMNGSNPLFTVGSTLLQGIMSKYVYDNTNTYYEYYAANFIGF